ncbi:hypothetical protein IG631_06946 [Alternaria alternata]|nr:hypothetical protein IG631_06946 [Alternaria alternata]
MQISSFSTVPTDPAVTAPPSLCIPRAALAYDPHRYFRPEPQIAARRSACPGRVVGVRRNR